MVFLYLLAWSTAMSLIFLTAVSICPSSFVNWPRLRSILDSVSGRMEGACREFVLSKNIFRTASSEHLTWMVVRNWTPTRVSASALRLPAVQRLSSVSLMKCFHTWAEKQSSGYTRQTCKRWSPRYLLVSRSLQPPNYIIVKIFAN